MLRPVQMVRLAHHERNLPFNRCATFKSFEGMKTRRELPRLGNSRNVEMISHRQMLARLGREETQGVTFLGVGPSLMTPKSTDVLEGAPHSRARPKQSQSIFFIFRVPEVA